MNPMSIKPTITRTRTKDGRVGLKGETVLPDGRRLFCYSYVFDTDAKADAWLAKKGKKR